MTIKLINLHGNVESR